MPGPFNRSYTLRKLDSAYRSYISEALNYTWSTSPRVAGRLVLQTNPMTRNFMSVTGYRIAGHVGFAPPLSTSPPPYVDSYWSGEVAQATDWAYSVLMGRLRGDSAGLGVTFGSWNQTAGMVSLRGNTIARFASWCYKNALGPKASKKEISKARKRARLFWLKQPLNRKIRRPCPKDVRHGSSADLFLEGFFGWQPLLVDIYNSYLALAGDLPFGYVSGSSKIVKSATYSGALDANSAIGTVRVKQTAMFRVTNPNAWLLNKLGLVNPALVAWDLVPWSFMVNRIVNVNQFLSSYTDTFGLSVTQPSRTVAVTTFQTASIMNSYPKTHPFWAQTSCSLITRNKSRVLVALTPPKLTVRAPGFSLSQGIIDVSLATQQVRRLRST